MIGWLIVLGVLILISITAILIDKYTRLKLDATAINIITIPLALITVMVLVVQSLTVREEVKRFDYYEDMIEETYNGGDITDVGINVKVIEMNEWLANAKASEELYGIFSFYHNALDDLEYIKIE